MSWAVEKVIQSAGIPLENVDDDLVDLAELCLERCYYIERAAEEMLRILTGPRW
jgi:hypothetical protein